MTFRRLLPKVPCVKRPSSSSDDWPKKEYTTEKITVSFERSIRSSLRSRSENVKRNRKTNPDHVENFDRNHCSNIVGFSLFFVSSVREESPTNSSPKTGDNGGSQKRDLRIEFFFRRNFRFCSTFTLVDLAAVTARR